jgi:hypothetical protein
MRIRGNTFLVTGGSSGLGAASVAHNTRMSLRSNARYSATCRAYFGDGRSESNCNNSISQSKRRSK